MPLNKAFINEVLNHIIDISNNKCTICEKSILEIYEEDEKKAELLSGLLFLNETIDFEKNKYIETNKELSERNKDLEEFAYIASHDLKSPLRAIYALASFIEEDINDNNLENVFDSISKLKNRIVKMENLIEALLEYSKLVNSEYVFEWIDINTSLEEVKDLLFIPKNVIFKISNDLPKVYGIKTKIFQLFYNLIDNAIKYNDKENTIITINATIKEGSIYYYINDNGPGIEAKYFDKIFELFQTLDSSENNKGTGIGLSLVKKIVELHKGKISIESETATGTTFIISFPLDVKK